MYTVFTYLVTLIVIVISVFVTLYFKNELERMFREEKDVLPFHICNVVIILMVSFITHTVMSKFIVEKSTNWILQLIMLLCITMPIYIAGHFAFQKYKSVYRKYITAEDGKVIVLNEKYLTKKRSSKLNNYNAIFKEK